MAGLHLRRGPWCVLPLAGLALACSRGGRDEVGRAVVTSIVMVVDAGGGSGATEEDDLALAHDLRAALASDDTLSARARTIEIEVRGGVVTLRGRVSNLREHDDLIRKAKRAGALSVADDLVVSGTRTPAWPGARGR